MVTEEVRLVVEIGVFVVAIGTILWRLSSATTRFELIGSQQASEITEIKVAIQKMETIFSLVAVEKVRLDHMSDRINSLEKRTDGRISTLEKRMDDLAHGRGYIVSGGSRGEGTHGKD